MPASPFLSTPEPPCGRLLRAGPRCASAWLARHACAALLVCDRFSFVLLAARLVRVGFSAVRSPVPKISYCLRGHKLPQGTSNYALKGFFINPIELCF
jgi:hypothetical protein